ncbi:MAG: DNA polymerase III subunit beta [Candidatus Magasanikbacteria bacterium]|nr:DNA polymerase III subunit beta [Candidatus Magasanikbacteria bacterium]
MKISCTRENLSRSLALTNGITGKNLNLPILSNILIKVDEQKVELVATNLELAVVSTIRAKVENPGQFTVPARTLTDYVNLLPNEKIDLELKDNELVVACGKAATKIKGTPADDFPIIPTMEDGKGYTLNASELKNALAQVLSAVARNDIRPELSGVFFNLNPENGEGKLILAATDSYRLAEKKLAIQQGGDQHSVIVPGRTAQEIQHLLATSGEESEPNARVMVSDNQIMVSFNNTQIISRLVDGKYPDYTQIIPKDFAATALVDTFQLTKEMKAAGLFTTTGVNAVSLAFKPTVGSISVSSTSTQTGEYASELSGDITGAENTILLNNKYVLDGLNNFNTAQTEIKIVSGDSPCIFEPAGDKNYIYIVMPIRQ